MKVQNVTVDWPSQEIEYTHFFFGGGEQHIQLKLDEIGVPNSVVIFMQYMQDSELVKLAILVDALRRSGNTFIQLVIPYFPGARQDRVCNVGESLTARVYADLINGLNLDEVVVFDPHSDVVGALLNNVHIVDNTEFVKDVLRYEKLCFFALGDTNDTVFISPDAGSNKKVANVAKHILKTEAMLIPVIRADKLRDVATGKIIETTIYADNLDGKTCVIVDDICSKGGTFCALAQDLIKKGASKVILIVSHYEGTADPRILKESGIDKVYTTNSKAFNTPNDLVVVYDVEKYCK